MLVLYEEIFEQLKHFPSAGCEEGREEGGVQVCHVPVVEWQSRPGKATTADTPAHVSEVIWEKIAESTTPLQDLHIFLNLTTWNGLR